MFVMTHTHIYMHAYKHIYFQTIQIEITYSIFYYIRNPYTIIHHNHDIEMRLLEWNKDNDNQFEIHGSIGKIHKSFAIYRIVYIYI